MLRSRREGLLLVPCILRLLLLLLWGSLLPRRRGLCWHLYVLGSRVLPVRRLWLLLVLLSRRCLLLRRLLVRWLRVSSWSWRLGSILGLLGILLQWLLEVRVWGWRSFRRSTGRRKWVLTWLLEVKGSIRVTGRRRANRLRGIGLLLGKRKVTHLRGRSFTGRIVCLWWILVWRCRCPPAILSWWLLWLWLLLLLLLLGVLMLRRTGYRGTLIVIGILRLRCRLIRIWIRRLGSRSAIVLLRLACVEAFRRASVVGRNVGL